MVIEAKLGIAFERLHSETRVDRHRVIRADGADRLFGLFINDINDINNHIVYTVSREVSYRPYNASSRTKHRAAAKNSLLEELAGWRIRHRFAAASGYIINLRTRTRCTSMPQPPLVVVIARTFSLTMASSTPIAPATGITAAYASSTSMPVML